MQSKEESKYNKLLYKSSLQFTVDNLKERSQTRDATVTSDWTEEQANQ